MNPHPAPAPDAEMKQFLVTLGLDPDGDFATELEVDISALPRTRWELGMKVTPPAPILRYLASGDTLTAHTIEMMEIAIEKAYSIGSPWYIDTTKTGTEAGEDLAVTGFFLMK